MSEVEHMTKNIQEMVLLVETWATSSNYFLCRANVPPFFHFITSQHHFQTHENCIVYSVLAFKKCHFICNVDTARSDRYMLRVRMCVLIFSLPVSAISCKVIMEYGGSWSLKNKTVCTDCDKSLVFNTPECHASQTLLHILWCVHLLMSMLYTNGNGASQSEHLTRKRISSVCDPVDTASEII